MTPAILAIIQGLIAAIPAGVELWKSIIQVKISNPNMSQTDINNLVLQMTATIGELGADELATLALIPAVPKA